MIRTLVCILCSLPPAIAAQPLDATAGLEEGVRYVFNVSKHITHNGHDEQKSNSRIAFSIESSASGKQILRATLNSEDLSFTPQQLKFVGLQEKDFQTEYEFVLGDNLAIKGLQNWEAIREQKIHVTNRLFESMLQLKIIDEAAVTRAKNRIAKLYTSEQIVLATSSRRITPYLFGYGWKLTVGESIDQAVKLPNPFGGEPLPAVGSTTLDDDELTPDLVEYRYEQSLDPQGVRSVLRNTFELMGLPSNEIEKQFDSIAINDTMKWSYDPSQNLIIKSSLKRVSTFQGQGTRIEMYNWELISTEDVSN